MSITRNNGYININVTVPFSTILAGGAFALASLGALSLRAKSFSAGKKKDKFQDATNPADFVAWGNALLKWIADYRTKCKTLPIISKVEPNYLQRALPMAAPMEAEGWGAIMEDLDSKILPGITHWEASNKFFAYFKPHSR